MNLRRSVCVTEAPASAITMNPPQFPRPWRWVPLVGVVLFGLSGAGLGIRADPVVLYETGFEPFEGLSPDEDLMGQGNRIGYATELVGKPALACGNGVLAEPVSGFAGEYE